MELPHSKMIYISFPNGQLIFSFGVTSISKLNAYGAKLKKRRQMAPPTWVNEVLVFQSKEILYQLTKRVYHNIQEK
ncbi:hypothetical protein CN912_26785 [Bacillus cereus]|nr:hypothetical protein CN484_21465 [Bacillus cereus]PGL05494.1 hypothetical protein CN912_26785 [Bacillus cereus]